MNVNIDDIIKTFSTKRQKSIKTESAKLIKEYNGLQEFRKAIGLTQEELAGELKMSQVNISRLESRGDMHLSTLKKYVEALGCDLEINIKIPGHSSVRLDNVPRI